jgi:transposase-like protein
VTDHSVFKLTQPGTFCDPLTEVLRTGARALLAQAVEAEVAAFLDGHAEVRTEDGRRRVVRHGHLPEREIMTGIGPVSVRAPRVRDRAGQGENRIRFTSAMLPPYARRSKSLEVLIPILYLKGVSTGDFAEALAALLSGWGWRPVRRACRSASPRPPPSCMNCSKPATRSGCCACNASLRDTSC